ncbi:MAG: PLDc N-terminal domain-containing protein [Desulfovibrio sp.]
MFFSLPAFSVEQWIVIGAIVATFLCLTLIGIIDAFNRDFNGSSNEKFAWLQLIILLPFLGVIGYFIFGRKRGRKL